MFHVNSEKGMLARDECRANDDFGEHVGTQLTASRATAANLLSDLDSELTMRDTGMP